MLGVVFIIGLIGLLVAGYLAYTVMNYGTGSKDMQKVAAAIKEGAEAFLKTQYKTIGILALVVAVLIYGIYSYTGHGDLAVKTTVSFIVGAFLSAIAGILGMVVSARANLRTAAAANKSVSEAFTVALRAGAISGFIIVSMVLIGISTLFYLFGANGQETPFMIVGFGFGASFVALFAQLGGGIYTKAADVGADLVGKVEAGIPEDDPRNPAVIADLVGDNVGDCAGRGADIFESTAAENIGAMILGVALWPHFGMSGVLFPLVVTAFGMLASIVGVFVANMRDDKEHPMAPLNRGFYVTAFLSAIAYYFITMKMLGSAWFFWAGLVGIGMSIGILLVTQYYTDTKYRPVREIAKSSETGPATNVITGIAMGFECVAAPGILIAVALILSYWCGTMSGLEHGGLYGTAMATMGMLTTAAYVLAMDNFGPITDNAGGIVEMSKAPKKIRDRTDALDAVGNTTKALTKGYAIGSAALAAFLLFSAYMDEVSKITGAIFDVVNLANVKIFVGAFLGAVLVFLFTSFAIRAVGVTAQLVIEEVRRQFKNKGIMSGKVKPDYAKCVEITTAGALKQMVLPGALVIVFPIVVGLWLRAEAMAAFLMVATIAGILVALFLNNAGGAWDNAKKYLESIGKKGSEAHKAAVVGDTIGDPFKDTAGPSLHVLIKLLATLTLVLAPLFI